MIFGVWLAALPAIAQPSSSPHPADQFFSGTVTDLSANHITVNRVILGKDSSTRTFAITPETRIEGKLKVQARVTVRFVPTEEGDKAVHIVVRSGPKK